VFRDLVDHFDGRVDVGGGGGGAAGRLDMELFLWTGELLMEPDLIFAALVVVVNGLGGAAGLVGRVKVDDAGRVVVVVVRVVEPEPGRDFDCMVG